VIAAWQRTTHRLLAAIDAELADLGLTAGEINALAALGAGARTARELADATGQRPSTLTGVLDRLERRGLLVRRPNPADRRSILLVTTPQGHAHARRVGAAFAAVEARIAGAVAMVQLEALLAAVDTALARER
jgi:DNA-binding MarR family transcriptional regulator